MDEEQKRLAKIRACVATLGETATRINGVFGQNAQDLRRCIQVLDELFPAPTVRSPDYVKALNVECANLTLKRRLNDGELRNTAQCRACFATWPRASLDWSEKIRVQIGTNDSWGNWKVYSNFLKCSACGELAVSDEEVITGE
jgi:hypothetical protein